MGPSGDASDVTKTKIPLPPLVDPPQNSFITALLVAPASVRSYSPFTLTLRVTNSHPSIPASYLTIQADTAEAFVWHGSRSAQIATVQPGETGEVNLEIMAVGGVGWFALPSLKVFDGEGDRRSEIRLSNNPQEDRAEKGKDGPVVLVRP